MRKVVALVLGVFVLGQLSASATVGQDKKWRDQGSILVHGATYVTLIEWAFRCPEIPLTQGVGGYVFEIPPEFANGKAIADVRTTSGTPGPLGSGYFMGFSGADCAALGTTGESAGMVPAGTRWIYVTNHLEAPIEFELTLIIDSNRRYVQTRGPRGRPTARPTEAPSSPSPEPPPTSSPRPTGAPTTQAPIPPDNR